MAVEITIPSPGESITEVVLGDWLKQDGDWVEKDESLVEIESDKVTLEVPAPESGALKVTAESGAEMNVGDAIGSVDPSAEKPASAGSAEKPADAGGGEKAATSSSSGTESNGAASSAPAAKVEEATAQAASGGGDDEGVGSGGGGGTATAAPPAGDVKATSVARKIAAEQGVDLGSIGSGSGPSGRITKADVMAASSRGGSAPDGAATSAPAPGSDGDGGSRNVRRQKMSKLRQRIAERLVDAQQTAAMLTTFNEVDMTEVMALRKRHKEAFAEKHGVGLGFMSFFVKACCSGLKVYEGINAYIVGDEFEYHDFCDVSVAVGTPKGLVVPVVRNAESMSFAEIESTIKNFAVRAQKGKLSIDEMTGGTFTISNGGVYGSLCSTPILNPPQSGILGMHAIKKVPREHPDKPGEIALRPIMQLALSYDHRIVDGEQAVRFLVHVKECLEAPEKLLLDL